MLEFDQNQSALELDSDLSELFACGKQDRSDLINGLWGDAKGRRALITKVSDSTKKRYQLYSGAGQLVWEEDSDGVKKRHVYLGGTLLAREEIGSALSSNSFLRTPAAAGSYQYRVTAVNAVGNRGAGASSAFVSYNPGNPPCTPAVPAGFAATPTLSVDGNFQLSWQASCNTLRYSIEERINGGAYALFSDVPAPNLSLSISGKPSGIYEYRIMACSPDSKKLPMLCSVVSLPISVQVAIPGGLLAPTNFALAPGSQTYTNGDYWFQWNAVSGASHYQVCEYDVAGGVANACRIFAALNSSAQKYRHTIDDQLLTFFYDVAACSATACSAASRPQKAVKIDCPPGTPPNLCVGSRPSDTTNEAGTVTYIHTDQLGSPVAETNATGTLTQRFRYEPFGQSLEANVAQGPSYTGHVADSASGLIYMQQRYYDPVLGRFLSTDPDPVGELGLNFNRYAYVGNNPYKYVDPDGRAIVSVNSANNEKLAGYINERTPGVFGFDKNNKLELVSEKGGSTPGSNYYQEKLNSAISEDMNINVDIGSTISDDFGNSASVDDLGGGGTTMRRHPDATAEMSVVISGNSNTKVGAGPAQILSHELVGHAIPSAVGSDSGNGIVNENKVNAEVGAPLREVVEHPEFK